MARSQPVARPKHTKTWWQELSEPTKMSIIVVVLGILAMAVMAVISLISSDFEIAVQYTAVMQIVMTAMIGAIMVVVIRLATRVLRIEQAQEEILSDTNRISSNMFEYLDLDQETPAEAAAEAAILATLQDASETPAPAVEVAQVADLGDTQEFTPIKTTKAESNITAYPFGTTQEVPVNMVRQIKLELTAAELGVLADTAGISLDELSLQSLCEQLEVQPDDFEETTESMALVIYQSDLDFFREAIIQPAPAVAPVEPKKAKVSSLETYKIAHALKMSPSMLVNILETFGVQEFRDLPEDVKMSLDHNAVLDQLSSARRPG